MSVANIVCIFFQSPQVATKLMFERMRDWFLTMLAVLALALVGVILTGRMLFFHRAENIGLFAVPVA